MPHEEKLVFAEFRDPEGKRVYFVGTSLACIKDDAKDAGPGGFGWRGFSFSRRVPEKEVEELFGMERLARGRIAILLGGRRSYAFGFPPSPVK